MQNPYGLHLNKAFVLLRQFSHKSVFIVWRICTNPLLFPLRFLSSTIVTYDLILSRQELKFLYIYDFHFLQRLVICHLLIYKPWRSPRCLYACAGPHDTSLTRAARGPMRSNYLGQVLCPDLVFAQHLIPQIWDNLQYPGVSIKVPSHLWSHGSSRTWLQHSPSQG